MTATTGPATPAPTPSSFVTVLAWLGIILHGLLVLTAAMQAIVMRSMLQDPAWIATMTKAYSTTPVPEVGPFMLGIARFIFLALLGYALLGLAASIGLLHRRNWARVTTIVMLALTAIWTGVMTVVQVLSRGMSLPASAAYPGLPDMTQMIATMRIFGIIFGLVTLATCAWLIWRLVSAPIRAEFVRAEG